MHKPTLHEKANMKRALLPLFGILIVTLLASCSSSEEVVRPEHQKQAASASPAGASASEIDRVPAWAQDAIFYQIFPERFRNGDPSNDPTRASLETPIADRVPESWRVTEWTSDWYARAGWEQKMGDDFYENGVFDRRYGGDLQGVIDKLSYLDRLGINAIYFNPVFWARSLHKYDGNTYHHIDPHFGPDPQGDFAEMKAEDPDDPATWRWTSADSLFLELIQRAHDRDIRVIIDGVFNHTGRDFFAFQDLQKRQQQSPYKDWYIVENYDDPATPDTNEFDYEGWWGVETLPLFADNAAGDDLHPGPKRYVFQATRRWMDPNGDGDPSDGIDGWRLDVAEDVPIGFWADWNRHVREINPRAYTVTEIWEDAAKFLQEGGFSATMNYYGFAFPVKGFLIDDALAPSGFAEMLNARRAAYRKPIQYALQNLIDSHDTPRLPSMIVNADTSYERPERFDYDWGDTVSPRHTNDYDVRAPTERERQIQRLVALFQMTYVGAPMIYYGDEAGLWGADDPDDRKPMLWADLDYQPEMRDPLSRKRATDSVSFNRALHDYYRRVITLRREHPALRRGTFRVLKTADDGGTFVFGRAHQGEHVIVALNRSDAAHSLHVPLPAPWRGSYGPLAGAAVGADGARVQMDEQALLLELPPLSGMVLRQTD